MSDLYIIALATIVGVVAWRLVANVRAALLRHRLLDHPNARSSHSHATPRGGGIAILAAALPAWLVLSLEGAAGDPARWLVPACALALAIVSFFDDVRGLSQLVRLAAQAVAVIICVQFLPGPVFQGLFAPALDTALAALVWLWFVNLFNFMDGIDGIAGVEAVGIGLGLYVIGLAFAAPAADYGQALVVAAAMAGFLVWNWHPARIFLGDVGSIPLGFLLGWLLLKLAGTGMWQAALILPLYYLADASLTLLRRLGRGERVWQAHREHCYQIAVQRGRSHAAVASAVALTNLLLIVFAVIAARPASGTLLTWTMVAAAGLAVAGLMAWMVLAPRTNSGNRP